MSKLYISPPTPRHKARTLAIGNVGRGSGLLAVLGPGEGVGVDLGFDVVDPVDPRAQHLMSLYAQ